MAQGEILWFDTTRGFGFIRPDMGPKDVFMHVSALVEAGNSELAAGMRVEFELVQGADGRLLAHRVLRLGGGPSKPQGPPSGRGPRRER